MKMLSRQRGVAVITALLLTTLAVTIVASLFWQQQVQVRSMENQRLHLQTKWILRGALDWARLILHQDGVDHPTLTTLDAVWATPLAETRLDQYIERERVQGENFDATLSGQVVDAQSRYNLANLTQQQQVDQKQVVVFGRLLSNLHLDADLAQRAATAMAKAQLPPATALVTPNPAPVPVTPAGGTAPVEFTQLEDLLSVPGFTPEAIAKLRDFVLVLPETSAVNVNTAPAEVLAAVIDFSLADAQALVASRKQAYFRDMAGFTQRLNGKTALLTKAQQIEVYSNFFLVESKVRLDRANLNAQALIMRKGVAQPKLVWMREY